MGKEIMMLLPKKRLFFAFLLAPIIGFPFCLPLARFDLLFLLFPHALMLVYGLPFIIFSYNRGRHSLGHYISGGLWVAVLVCLYFFVYFLYVENIGVAQLAAFFAFIFSIIPGFGAALISWLIMIKVFRAANRI